MNEIAMRQLVGDRDERAARMASNAIVDQVQQRANEIRILVGQVSGTSVEKGRAVLSNAAYLQSDFISLPVSTALTNHGQGPAAAAELG